MVRQFTEPLLVLFGILIYLILNIFHLNSYANIVIFFAIILGSYRMFWESALALKNKEFILDYIAMLAVIVSIIADQYLVGAIIALMISSGTTLENYGASRAKQTLTGLIDRIPNQVYLFLNGQPTERVSINNIKIGQQVYLRKGEVIPLDGILVSQAGLVDEASLTGEPYAVEKIEGDQIRNGTVNVGEPIVIAVNRLQKDSTYNKIVRMVEKAQLEKAPMVRLADKYSVFFTVLTFIIAATAYLYSHQLEKILAVLVVATPCPLILATPIALIGGMNAAAKKRIVIKKLASLEVLSRVNAIVFDKTGTITIGLPKVVEFKNYSWDLADKQVLAIAESIERSSLHPLAKALVDFAKIKKAPVEHAKNIKEVIGEGIFGEVDGKKYRLVKSKKEEGMIIELTSAAKLIAVFRFEDQIKGESKVIINSLKKQGYKLYIFTGDKYESAKKTLEQLGETVILRAGLKPEDKQKGIEELKKQKNIVGMVGDGINDAPALALADVGMVFSNDEQTAASEAADVVFFGGDFTKVTESMLISKKTVHIAMQSILVGIGLSVVAMLFAAGGYIPPIYGALLQELIDVGVILNALRASRV